LRSKIQRIANSKTASTVTPAAVQKTTFSEDR
jgi:hypothetical protein